MINNAWLKPIKTETWVVLALSLGYFLVKGIRYALIGSSIPLIIILLVMATLILSARRSPKWFRRSLRYWGILLLLWAAGRLLVELLFHLVPSITETHIREQFTIFQKVISILFLLVGVHLVRHSKKQKPLQ